MFLIPYFVCLITNPQWICLSCTIIKTNESIQLNIFYNPQITFHTEHAPEQPKKPNITVTVSSPVLQIVEVGNTVRLACTGYHIIDRVSFLISTICGT